MHEKGSIKNTILRLVQIPKSISKRLLARIWPKMAVSCLSYVSGLVTSWGLPKSSGRFQSFLWQWFNNQLGLAQLQKIPGRILPKMAVSSASYVSESFLCQRFICQLVLVQMPKFSSKKIPGHDFAQNCRFQPSLCQRFINQMGPAQMQKSTSKRFLARIWPKMAVSSFSFVSGLMTSWGVCKRLLPGHHFAQHGRFQPFLCQRSNHHLGPAQMPKSSSKKFLARIWPKMAVSSASYVSESFLCQRFNSQLVPFQMPISSSKKLLARIWPKMVISSLSYASGLITSWGLPKCQNPAPKSSWPGFGPKWPFPVFLLSAAE